MFNPQPVALQRGALRLDPLAEADIPALVTLAEANREALVYMSGPLRPDWYRQGLAAQREGDALVFAIRLGDNLVGTTRFADFMPSLPAAEIGWTWLAGSEHGSGLNASIKYLMLRHAFEDWQLVRVQLKTAASNLRAQGAIEKLGALKPGHHYLRAIILDKFQNAEQALAEYELFLAGSNGQNEDEEFKARQRVRILKNMKNR